MGRGRFTAHIAHSTHPRTRRHSFPYLRTGSTPHDLRCFLIIVTLHFTKATVRETSCAGQGAAAAQWLSSTSTCSLPHRSVALATLWSRTRRAPAYAVNMSAV